MIYVMGVYMSEEMKIMNQSVKSFSRQDCDEHGSIVKKCFAKLSLEYGKIEDCNNKELADILVKFATDLLIEARNLEETDKE